MARRLTRDEQRAATRAALLRSAGEVFVERGFDGAPIEEISERAGYSRGAFYSNFASKEECFLELLEQRSTQHLETVAEAFAAGTSLRERLDEAGKVVDEHLRTDRQWCMLYVEAWTVASRNDELGTRFSEQYRAWRHGITEIIRTAPEVDSTGDPEQIDVLAGAVIALFEGGMLQVVIESDALPDDFFSRAFRLLFSEALRD